MRLAASKRADTDGELVVRVAAGNLAALGELFDRYEPDVRRFLGRLGVSASDLDDLVQATFLEVLHAAPRYDPSFAVKVWLLGLAAILVRRHRRSLGRAAARLLSWASLPPREPPPTPAVLVENDQELRRFQEAFERLSIKKREVFALVVLEGLSGEEVASLLAIPVNTVWTRLHHARRELRTALDPEAS